MRKAGKTVINVMVVGAAVVATMIGVVVALPYLMYPAFAERMHRTEVLNAMNRIQASQELFRLRNGTYTDDLSALGFADGCTENCVYLVSVAVADTRTFRAQFVPNPAGGTNGVNQVGDEGCQSFTIDALGRRSAENQRCLEVR